MTHDAGPLFADLPARPGKVVAVHLNYISRAEQRGRRPGKERFHEGLAKAIGRAALCAGWCPGRIQAELAAIAADSAGFSAAAALVDQGLMRAQYILLGKGTSEAHSAAQDIFDGAG